MPIFEVKGPDGKTYEADAPNLAAAAAAFAPKTPPQAPLGDTVPQGGPGWGAQPPAAPVAPPSLQSRLQAPATGVSNAFAHTLGLPVDAATSVINLGRTLGGQERMPLDSQVGGGDWMEHALNQWGVQTQPDNPNDAVQRYGAAAGTVAPALASGNIGTGLRALAGAFGSQYLADQGHPDLATIAGVASNKTGLADLTRAGAKTALASLERTAAPEVRAGVADAQATAPGLQTVAQTAGRPFLVKTGAAAAGATTQQASKGIIDSLTKGLEAQAASLAPLGVDTPAVASRVQEAIETKDKTIASRQEAVYNAGRRQVAAQPGMVSTDNTVAALDRMKAEIADPTNLAPPEVSKRLEGLIDTLRGKPATTAPSTILGADGAPAALTTTPATPGGTTWGGFYDLRKQINTLFDTVPKDQITPALNATFARLKQGYYADLDAAPDGPAKAATVKANDVYAGLAEKREDLHNSVVASILGKDGKTSVADPDKVLTRLVTMEPAAQEYTRNMIQTYAPDVLDNLRSYAITKSVQDASRDTHSSTVAGTNPAKLSPGTLADSGLFTKAQAAELRSRQAALETALNALPERATQTNSDISPQSVGRVAVSGSSTFIGGMLATVGLSGKIERALNTPAGRNKILAASQSKDQGVQTAVRAYQAALLAQVQAERKQNANTPQ